MIRGQVEWDEALLRIKICGRDGSSVAVNATIDTGYNGCITLPKAIIRKLNLEWLSEGVSILGDGTECLFDRYIACIYWDRKLKPIIVDSSEGVTLLGMELLMGYEVKIQVRHRGKVTVRKMHE